MNSYPFPRPSAPVQLYLLAVLSAFGLAAMWLAALHAFLQVAGGPQAFFAATLIEAGLIIEALALIKRPKVWYTWVAVAISLIVSGTYNYIQADLAAPDFNPWQLGTLALGPLSALCFVSLTLGYELREYQNRVETWQADRGNWIEQRRQEQEAYQRKLDEQRMADIRRMQDAERTRQEREAERRFQAEESERAWQHHQQELAQRRLERKDEVARRGQRQVELAQAGSLLAQISLEPAQSELEPLKCQHCGATAGKSGAPFRTQAALNAHQAYCPGLRATDSQLLEPVVLAPNGKD